MRNTLKNILFVLLFSLSASVFAGPVNINTADAKTLSSSISGIGDKKAEAIVQYRKSHGPFKTVDDLARVKGIGPKIIEKNRAVLVVKKQ